METAKPQISEFTYRRHEPEKTLLYQVLARQWDSWLMERRADTTRSPLPDYIEREVEAFFRCGILHHGYVLMSCESCDEKIPVAFSCKKRGYCPSCAAKRTSEATIHLIDNVLPLAPYRQYVVTFPHSLRFWLATIMRVFRIDITRCPECGGRIFPGNCSVITDAPRLFGILIALSINVHPPPREKKPPHEDNECDRRICCAEE